MKVFAPRLFAPLALAASLIFTVNCRPPEEDGVRLGYLDEYCEGDQDCKSPLFCNRTLNVCELEDTPGSVSCSDICDRLVGECGRNETDCVGSCRETIDGWSAEAIDVFGTCSLGLTTPALTCELAVTPDAPSFCYRQIPMDPARQARCDTFVEQARAYADNATESQLINLRQNCYIIARTRSENDWASTNECDESSVSLTPQEVLDCYNEKFTLDVAFTAAP